MACNISLSDTTTSDSVEMSKTKVLTIVAFLRVYIGMSKLSPNISDHVLSCTNWRQTVNGWQENMGLLQATPDKDTIFSEDGNVLNNVTWKRPSTYDYLNKKKNLVLSKLWKETHEISSKPLKWFFKRNASLTTLSFVDKILCRTVLWLTH